MPTNNNIPLNLFQFESDDDVRSRNSEFSYYTFEIDSARSLIIENFPKFSDLLTNSDENYIKGLWKLCCLYIHGGIFLDNDYRCEDHFKLIDLTDKEYFLYSARFRLSGSILSVLPKTLLILKAINQYSGSPTIICKKNINTLLKLNKVHNVITFNGNIIIRSVDSLFDPNPFPDKKTNNIISNNYFDFNYANTFCVSLEKRNDRWEKFINRAKYIGLEVTRWKASTPNDLTDVFIDTLTGVEKACAQSHINIWKHILNTGLEYAFILEDDACFDRNMFEKLLELTKMFESGKKWDAVFLNTLGDFNVPIEYYKWAPAIKQYLTGGYIISNKGARFIIDKFQNTKYIAADHMTMALQANGNCFTYCPWLIIQEAKESDIQSSAHLYNVLKNIKYNLALANYPFDNTNYVINPPITSAFKLLSDTRLLFHEKNTFCINLMSRPDRWQKFSKRASDIGLNFTRWNASTCDNLTDEFMINLIPAEKACAQSHVNIWKHIIDTGLEFAFILEDDACFDRLIFDKLLKFTELNKKWDAIFLNSLNDKYPDKLFEWVNVYDQSLCGGYILSNSGATYMLDYYKKNNSGYNCSDKMTIKLQEMGNCYTYFPWIIVQENIESNIQTPQWLSRIDKLVKTQLLRARYEFNNHNYLIETKPTRRLCLITIWFGKLPPYIDIWLHTVKNANYDVLFITDQVINDCPVNIRCINTWIGEFNQMISEKIGFDVNIKSPSKLVDVKPLYGFLYHDFICHDYEYWGWTDVDMIMGDVVSIIDKSPGYEAYSLGYSTFGPLMIFSINYTDFFKGIERYDEILNDTFICKVDEMWFFERLGSCIDQNIYNDENAPVKYYSGKNLKNIFDENSMVHIDRFDLACGFLNWHIKGKLAEGVFLQESKYYFTNDNKLFKNDKEIAFCHLTWIKYNNYFCDFMRNNCLLADHFSVKISFKFTLPSGLNSKILTDYNITQFYSNFAELSIFNLDIISDSNIVSKPNLTTDTKIPLNLFQFVADTDIQSQNSEFSYYTFEIEAARLFIIEKFPKFSGTLNNADEYYIKGLWKLCCLFVYGGIFLDNDYKCADDFKLVELTDKEYYFTIAPMRLSGSILSVFPNNRSIRRAINAYSGQSVIFKQGVVKPTLRINNKSGIVMLGKKVVMKLGNKKSEICEIESVCLFDVSNKNNGNIPLNLFQTWHTKDLPPAMKESVELLKSQNPEFTYYLFDDADCREFIAENFDYCVVEAFDRLIPGAYKADLWRYCVLYIRGGIYLDIKYHCINGFKLVELTNKEYFVRDRPGFITEKKDGIGIYNAFMVCYPKNKKLLKCIYQIVENIRNNYYGRTALYPTGPGLLRDYFSDSETDGFSLDFNFIGVDTILHNKTRKILESYGSYRLEQKITQVNLDYKNLWTNRNIYKSKNINDYVSVHSNNIKAKFVSNITGVYDKNVSFSMFKSQCYLNGITYGCERINRSKKNGLCLTKESDGVVFSNIEVGLDIEAEDPRLFSFEGEIYIVFICLSPYPDQNRGIGITMFDVWEPCFLRIRNIKNNYVEKNWSPFVKDGVLLFVYNYDPLVIIRYNFDRDGICEIVFKQNDVRLPIDTSKKYLRGGSNLIHYKNQYYIGACHSRLVDKVPIIYNTHVVLLDASLWNIRYLSKPLAYTHDDTNCNLTKIPGTNILRHCSNIPGNRSLHIINSPCSIYEKNGLFFITVNINDKITLLFELEFDISIDDNKSYSIGELEKSTLCYSKEFIGLL